jgi:colanic acid/amylovoran biosynthesis protein
MKILLIGMMGLYNRGCEAIIWGSSKIIKEIFPDAEIFVAVGFSESAKVDRERLHNFDVEIYPLVAGNIPNPSFGFRLIRNAIYQITRDFDIYKYRKPIGYPDKDWDLILEVGGDTFVGNPLIKFHYDQWLMKKGLKVGLWGLNLGPYNIQVISRDKQFKAFSKYNLITVRDKYSHHYLAGIGIKNNVYLMADPAFEMEAEFWGVEPYLPTKCGRGIVGINFNPIAAQSGKRNNKEIIKLLIDTSRSLIDQGFGVLLVPHCFPPSCPSYDDDTTILKPAFLQLKKEGLNVGLLPNGINSPQVKYAISKCILFTGIRMHSTIAAWSSDVPVLSLSYSQKSLNYNNEIYGHQEYVLDISTLTSKLLVRSLLSMANNLHKVKQETKQGVANLRRHTKDMIYKLKQNY